MCVIVQCLCVHVCTLVEHCADRLNEMAAVSRLSCESGCTGELKQTEQWREKKAVVKL